MASIPQMVYQGTPTITTNTAPLFGVINKYDASSGPLSVALPALSSLNPGVSCILQKSPSDLTSNTITFTPNGTDGFDNGASAVYLTQPGEIKVLQKITISGANVWMITNTVSDSSPYWALQPAGQICTLPRIQLNTSLPLASGTLHLAYFQAPAGVSALTISNVAVSTGDVAAAGVTLALIGIFSVDPVTGDLTLVAVSNSAATILEAGTYNNDSVSLTSPVSLVPGGTYAVGILVIASTMPEMVGEYVVGDANSVAPRLVGFVTSLTEMPTTVAAASIYNEYRLLYFRMF
ncbi:hypothetical protein BST29_19185 [Mycobacterium malmoense]|uniref:PE-PGRS family protein n=2 Tax=Mycobacterium malmoense TaxID=1780 RepID=A0ABX3SNE0_MYCMA|nr:hypothetical protein BMG05_20075 [Mycobacterium malmoense]ORA79462.1 hypothetical protein BST29_19185 [Mycobacterium malmoense]